MPNLSADARQQHPSRRTVLKVGANAAWAVPAIQIASATPAFAVSGDPTSTVSVAVLGYSRPNGNGTGYVIVQLTATNAPAKPVTVTVSGGAGAGSSVSAVSGPVALGTPTPLQIAVPFGNKNNARTLTITLNGKTDNDTAADVIATGTTTYPVPAGAATTAQWATLSLVNVDPERTWSWPSGWSNTFKLDFDIKSDVPAKDLQWTVAKLDGTVLKTGTASNITTANGTRSVSTSFTGTTHTTTVQIKVTGTTNDSNALPAHPASAQATA